MTGTKTRFAQNKFIDTAIVTAYFWNAKSGVGFEYASHFNPMPDPAIAFVLTAVRVFKSLREVCSFRSFVTDSYVDI